MAKNFRSKDGVINLRNIPDDIDVNNDYKFRQTIRNMYRAKDMEVPEEFKITNFEMGAGAMSNLGGSALQMGKDLVNMIANPIDTIGSLLDLGAGAVQLMLPDKIVDFVGEDKASKEKAKLMGNFYKSRYGSIEKAQETMSQDPAAVMGDVAMFLTGGAGAVSKLSTINRLGTVSQKAGSVAQAMKKGGELLDPVNLAIKGVGATATGVRKTLGRGTAGIGGFLSGTGSDVVGLAYQAGKTGDDITLKDMFKEGRKPQPGSIRADFWKYFSGAKKPEALVDELHEAFTALNKRKSDEWEAGMKRVEKNISMPSYSTLEQALSVIQKDAIDPNTAFKLSAPVTKTLEDINKIITEFRDNPKAQTLTGWDQLRRRIKNDILDNIPEYGPGVPGSVNMQRRAAESVLDAIKETIQKYEPSYNDTIVKYADASAMLDDFKRILKNQKSGLDRASALTEFTNAIMSKSDTGRFKSAAVLDLLGEAEALTGKNLQAMLAGVVLNSSNPKNISGRGMVGAGALSQATGMPGTLNMGAIPLSTPSFVGRTAYGMGRLSDIISSSVPRPGLFNVGMQPIRAGIPTDEEALQQGGVLAPFYNQ